MGQTRFFKEIQILHNVKFGKCHTTPTLGTVMYTPYFHMHALSLLKLTQTLHRGCNNVSIPHTILITDKLLLTM